MFCNIIAVYGICFKNAIVNNIDSYRILINVMYNL